MKKEGNSLKNRLIIYLFAFLSILFIVFFMTNSSFFNWVFERHQNQLSWYIRPLFLIPFCFFAYQKNGPGMAITIFCLFTSMFWFPKPEVVSNEVLEFLTFEKEWLTGEWSLYKGLFVLTIPLSFTLLGIAFWKRSLLLGCGVIVLMATGKMIWSIGNAGESGKSVLLPATIGLIMCVLLVYIGYKKSSKRNQ
ncbi:MAG: hypothetical protein KF704_05365 [Crocinitomicaceae bacterium]|nr:hypothetical protein [Crocinitomicaceae bacterium]NGF75658.1 hypothetical protein [Fluviicola sp. SGL-29]